MAPTPMTSLTGPQDPTVTLVPSPAPLTGVCLITSLSSLDPRPQVGSTALEHAGGSLEVGPEPLAPLDEAAQTWSCFPFMEHAGRRGFGSLRHIAGHTGQAHPRGPTQAPSSPAYFSCPRFQEFCPGPSCPPPGLCAAFLLHQLQGLCTHHSPQPQAA